MRSGTDDDYDPHEHRDVEKPTTTVDTLIHFLKGCLGTGILAMPEALKYAGMWNGIISTFLIAMLSTYCLGTLVHSQYLLCKKRKVGLLTYPESMKVACEEGPKCFNKLANIAPGITNFFLVFYQMGTMCIYILFVAKNIKSVLDEHTAKEYLLTYYFIALFIPFLAILCVRNLKLFVPFSFLANIITFITFGVILWYVCQGLPPFTDRPAMGSIYNYALYFGTTLFAIQSIPVVVALENNMKTPSSFLGICGVLNIAMSTVTIVYLIVGVLGYWKYGDDIESSITLNFPKKETIAQVINLLYASAIYISYGLQGYVPVTILWNDYVGKNLQENKNKLLFEYLLRFILVVITFFFSMVVPLLGLFISLIGCFCISALGIMFPALLDCCAHWPDQLGTCYYVIIRDLILAFIGIIGITAGSYGALYEIIRKIKTEDIYAQ